MDWQNGVVVVAILSAALHVAWRGWCALRRPAESGCSTGCASCPQGRETLISVDQLVAHKSVV